MPAVTSATLIAQVARHRAGPCAACGQPLCAHHVLVSIAAGFRHAPRCLPCLAAALRRDPDEFRRHAFAHIAHRDCYRGAWQWASAQVPCCSLEEAGSTGTNPDGATAGSLAADADWDAGDMGCGDLVLALRARLRGMSPDETLHVVARDPGAPEDIPAWCGMTGHRLVVAAHPHYVIQRRRE